MSLILLFLPHNNVPPSNQSAFTPAIVQEIQITKPVMVSIQEATGSFQTSTTTYSSSTDSYNSGIYAGADRVLVKNPLTYSIEAVSPTLVSAQEDQGAFQDSSIEYSSTTNTYNSGLYGGMDRQLAVINPPGSIDAIKPTAYSIEKM